MNFTLLASFLASALLCLFLTPFVKKVALKIGAVDKPDHRKVHTRLMPRMGGVAIYVSFVLSYVCVSIFYRNPIPEYGYALIFGGFIIVTTGVLDDMFQISPKQKLVGQFLATLIVVSLGIRVDHFNVPFHNGPVELGWFAIPLTFIWVIGITNAINLIDGLDGLASGVSGIAASAMFVISMMMGTFNISLISIILIGAVVGFLYHNFYPAKIFMGDSGSLFLGFFLSTVSLIGFKQVALVTFVIPILILAIPISDTMYAMIRRKLNKQPISAPDKNHLHHCLLSLGFSHRTTVFIIYGVSLMFAVLAVLVTKAALWFSLIALVFYILFFEIFAEAIGMMSKHQPILSLCRKIKSAFVR